MACCSFYPKQDIFSDNIKGFITSFEEAAEKVNEVNQKTVTLLVRDDNDTSLSQHLIDDDEETLNTTFYSLSKKATVTLKSKIKKGDQLYLTLPNVFYEWRESDCSVIKAAIKANEKRDMGYCRYKGTHLKSFVHRGKCYVGYKNNKVPDEHIYMLKLLEKVILVWSDSVYKSVVMAQEFIEERLSTNQAKKKTLFEATKVGGLKRMKKTAKKYIPLVDNIYIKPK